jgi:hypothetical protein
MDSFHSCGWKYTNNIVIKVALHHSHTTPFHESTCALCRARQPRQAIEPDEISRQCGHRPHGILTHL